MCGIVGQAGPLGSREAVDKALKLVKRRGPDNQDVWESGEVILGHARLAIIDLDKRSNQPMSFDGLTIAYNGELWNYRQLRKEIDPRDQLFKTESDTEVVLRAWQRWGWQCLHKLDGMFAFALWDGNELWLVKDRWGKIPLAFHLQMGTISFASERKALKFGMGVSDDLVHEIPPGCLLRWDLKTHLVHPEKWYKLSVVPSKDSMDQASDKVASHLWVGVEQRLISDVPLCTLMSGGLDSLAITYLIKKMAGSVTAFTAVYDQDSEDLHGARKVADELGIELVEVTIPIESDDQVKKEVARSVGDTELSYKAQVEIGIACHYLAKAIRERGFKVVFSGEGADELWGTYRAVKILSSKRNTIEKPGAWQEARVQQVVGQWRKNFPRCNKVFLAQGVECRLPFLHEPLVLYGLGLPTHIVDGKRVQKKAMLKLGVPERIINRPRAAFQTALGLSSRIQEVFPDPKKTYKELEVSIFGSGKRTSTEFDFRTGKYMKTWVTKKEE